MEKYSFMNDYSEGAHQNIIKALGETNLIQQNGYSEDKYTQEAVKLIKNRLNSQSSDVHIVSGGTQANLIVISSILRPHEAVVSAGTGHINVHEAGAIEATGHKVCTVNMSVVFPNDNYEIHSNIDLEKTNQNTYSTVLDEIPEEEWYFHYVSREGLPFGTNFIKTNNTIAGAIVVVTLALGFYLMKKKKKALSIIIFLLTIPEFFLFRFSGYGGLFLIFIGIPIALIAAIVVGLVKLYMKKKDRNRL